MMKQAFKGRTFEIGQVWIHEERKGERYCILAVNYSKRFVVASNFNIGGDYFGTKMYIMDDLYSYCYLDAGWEDVK